LLTSSESSKALFHLEADWDIALYIIMTSFSSALRFSMETFFILYFSPPSRIDDLTFASFLPWFDFLGILLEWDCIFISSIVIRQSLIVTSSSLKYDVLKHNSSKALGISITTKGITSLFSQLPHILWQSSVLDNQTLG